MLHLFSMLHLRRTAKTVKIATIARVSVECLTKKSSHMADKKKSKISLVLTLRKAFLLILGHQKSAWWIGWGKIGWATLWMRGLRARKVSAAKEKMVVDTYTLVINQIKRGRSVEWTQQIVIF